MFAGEGNPFYGQHHSEETKMKISKNRKGKCAGSEHWMYGQHHNQQSLEKISEHRKSKGGLKTSAGIGQCCIGKAKSAGKHPITKQPLHWKFI